MMDINRRALAAAAAATAGSLGLGGGAALAKPMNLSFPKGFVWGAATAAYQIEGAVNEDGRGRSIWDDFSHTPGKTLNGDTGDVACDGYHRYREDTQLLKNIGAKAYRFSTAWPRIFPEGRGTPNAKGVDHYKRVVDNLLENGIEPYVTLYHWDLPSALPGGWQSRDTSKAFADYAGYMAGQLGDRVNHFMTLNEMGTFVEAGYGGPAHAPGLKLRTAGLNEVRHNALLAHGLGVQAIRANSSRGVKVGLAENPAVVVPAIEMPEHIAAAKRAMARVNGAYLPAIMTGAYPEQYLTDQRGKGPKIEAGDMAVISSSIDFLGLNVYSPIYARADPNREDGFTILMPSASFPKMGLPWLNVGPEATYWAVRFATELWKPRAIFISENGCPTDDRLSGDQVNDTDRVMYLRNYLTHLHRAAAEGYPVKGYFLWSLLDNFEWAEGYGKRFGIHHVDFATQSRIPKLSALWYRELIRRNALV